MHFKSRKKTDCATSAPVTTLLVVRKRVIDPKKNHFLRNAEKLAEAASETSKRWLYKLSTGAYVVHTRYNNEITSDSLERVAPWTASHTFQISLIK